MKILCHSLNNNNALIKFDFHRSYDFPGIRIFTCLLYLSIPNRLKSFCILHSYSARNFHHRLRKVVRLYTVKCYQRIASSATAYFDQETIRRRAFCLFEVMTSYRLVEIYQLLFPYATYLLWAVHAFDFLPAQYF